MTADAAREFGIIDQVLSRRPEPTVPIGPSA
jgi:ATP-dependent protease ClpP protease subunit